MKIFFAEGEALRGNAGEALVLEAFRSYMGASWPDSFSDPEIARTPNGKPFFKGGDALPFFSISHSRGLWCCIFADFPVGIDIQDHVSRPKFAEKPKGVKSASIGARLKNDAETRDRDHRNVAQLSKRYFTDAETAYADLYGEIAFYRLWTRKEALVKLLDSKLYTTMKEYSLLTDEYELKESIEAGGRELFFGEVEIGEGISCSYCATKREPVVIEFI